MIRPILLGLAVLAAMLVTNAASDGAEKVAPPPKELQALLKHMKDKGIDLREVETKTQGSYIQSQFTIGPDYSKDQRVGFNYLPPLTLKEAQDEYMQYSLPYRFHGEWAIFEVGSRGGDDYEANWNKVYQALRQYPGEDKPHKRVVK